MSDRTVLAMSNLPFTPAHWDRFRAAVSPDRLVMVEPGDEAGLASALQEAEIAILPGDLDRRHVEAPRLRWVHCDHAGLTKSAMPEVFEKGLIVTGSAGRSGPALAEHALMFMLMLCSNYPAFYEAQKQRRWRGVPGMDGLRALYGRTIGIIGMGHTGVALAARAKAFNMQVLGYRRRDLPPADGVDRMYCQDRGDTIDPILDQADILALVVNLSDATHHMIGRPQLQRMKRSAIVVNLARGSVIDEQALVEALHAGEIAGAGLDVFETEPLPPDSPLWDAPNTLITPHFTAALPDKVDRSVDVITENFRRYRAGQSMLNRLSQEDLYTRRRAR
jgi:phosphoglycerate dehydrogenase-like enzyme